LGLEADGSAEVLGGLVTAYEHFDDKAEKAWHGEEKRRQGRSLVFEVSCSG
jgi:hypothetical protein